MLVDFNLKDYKVIKVGLERLLKDSTDKEYLSNLISYVDDCIQNETPVNSFEHTNDYRLTNKERNS